MKEKKNISKYTMTIIKQLKERAYLKSLWKTLHEYNDFINGLDDKKALSIKKKKNISLVINEEKNRKALFRDLRQKFDIQPGNLFIVSRQNKFYDEEKVKGFKIIFRGKEKTIPDILPLRNYRMSYDDISFYVYCENSEELKEKIKEEMKDILRKSLKDGRLHLDGYTDSKQLKKAKPAKQLSFNMPSK
jgi:hypothetical protein